MKLVAPNSRYSKSWQEALVEFEEEGCSGFWNFPEKLMNINEYIERTKNHSKGINIPEGLVRSSTFWLIDNGKFIGHTNIRHELNEKLEKIGGHIGYYIRPSERSKGFGNQILKLALIEVKKIGLKKILITCDIDNIPSQKIVKKNGGKFFDDIDADGRMIRRFWIST